METKQWTRQAVMAGFKILKPLRLGNAPEWSAKGALDDELNSWVLALMTARVCVTREADGPRIVEAFAKYSAHGRFWPRPADIIELLPERPRLQRPEALKAIPHLTEEQLVVNRSRWKALGRKLGVNFGESRHNEKRRAEGNAREKV